jgi:pyruvate/2-oxoglutarate dehydrogenase complex dihydrolipoamide dehydrogenase (E3) component
LQGCLDHLYQGLPITCLVNPQAGLEDEFRIKPAEKRKKVFIIGGGPGGMEAARVAALRGHDVTLVEKEDHLGGQFHLASLPPGKEEIKVFLQYLGGQLKKLGVKIFLKQEMSPDKIDQIEAEVIILTSGGTPQKPEIPGVERENVLTAGEALMNPERVGEKALVVGAGAVGAETAEFLADRGREVTLIEMVKEIALDEERVSRKLLLRRLGEKGVRVRVLTKARAIIPQGVEVEGGEILPADTVVLATGGQPNKSLEEGLKSSKLEFFSIGDCKTPRQAIDAIHEGFKTALNI